jgi:hypothetical protein
LIDALDRVRGTFVRALVGAQVLGAVVRRRESRITLRASLAILVAFGLATVAPAATLAISPLLLGVPHVASSIRYMVLRQRLPRAWLVVLMALAAIMMALRIAEQTHGARFARAEVACAALWALLAALWGSRGVPRRLTIALPLLGAAGAVAIAFPVAARLAFVHAHNLGAVVIWALLMQRNRAALPLVLLCAGLALLLSGAIAPLGASALGVDVDAVARWLTPGARAIAVPAVLAHVFTDSVHYAFWLGVIPEESLRHEGTLTFKMTWRALRRDFGDAGLAFVFVASAAFIVLPLFGLARARDAYFAVAGSHGYVEGAMLVYFLCGGQRATPTESGARQGSAIPHPAG